MILKKIRKNLDRIKDNQNLCRQILDQYNQDRLATRDYMNLMALQAEAANVHKDSFSKYRNYHRGREVAVIGSGPSLDRWTGKKDCIQIGVNGTFLSDKVNLDYLFMQDYDKKMIGLLAQRNMPQCQYFFGTHYMLPSVKPIPFHEIEKFNASQYFFYDNPRHTFPFDFTIDISSKPFIVYSSTIFAALQFALYTHPDRIYIVGCDCSDNHFSAHMSDLHNTKELHWNKITTGWEKFAQFADALYPDIEIVSINPVGLKGLFKDIYTS